ncbi:uncharacterized protein [Amphiura filiformis]|uniref:uncharacterized protein isoform X3 n=1 Tax=Amphiura filiformis TaxID=82378 RepID=UPI003B20F98C
MEENEEFQSPDFKRMRKQLRVVSFRTRPKDLDLSVEDDTTSVEESDRSLDDDEISDPHELEGVRASALNTSPSRVHHPGGAQFAQEGVATLARTASLDSAAVGAQVALIYQTLRTGKTT